jgi:acyl-CoA reductase-like NAD-dependent aldehyde dehydrogenase
VLPVIIFAVVAIPLLVIGFLVVSRNRRSGEHLATETDADRERTEREFAEAEEYQEEWREQTHDEVRDERFP